MAKGLAFPFKITRGSANTHDTNSDAWAAQRIASVVRTHVGELSLRPAFGVTESEFFGFDRGGLMVNCGTYFGDIDIEDVKERWNDDQSVSIEIPFKRTSEI
jgi:hypothetical protein